MSPHPVVLIGRMYHPDAEARLRAEVPVEILERPTPEGIAGALREAGGAFVRYPNKLPGEALAGARNLRIISTSGRGTVSTSTSTTRTRSCATTPRNGRPSTPPAGRWRGTA